MKKMVLAIFVGIFLIATTVQGASINFSASDPADVTDADFDITSFGASENGNTVTFWIEVRGNVNTHPSYGYLNAYVIYIHDSSHDVEIAGIWVNSSTYIYPVVYVETDSGGYSTLTPGQYVISGGRIEFHVDAMYFSNFESDYTVNVETAHAYGNDPSVISSYLDEATYSSTGGSSGGSTGGPSGGPPWYLWLIIGLIIAGVVVAVVLVLMRKPKQMPPQYPPPQYPQQPPQYPSQYPPPQQPQNPPPPGSPPEQ